MTKLMVIQDKLGMALHFDGANDYVSIPYSLNLNPNTFTISVWAKVESGQDTFRTVIASRDENRGYILYAAENNHWQFWVGNGTSWDSINGPPIILAQWTHLACVYDGIQMIFYVDGVQQGSPLTVSLDKNANFPLTLGKASDCNQYYFNGTIGEVRLWNVARTADEIKTDMFRSLTGSENGLVGYWRLDEGVGITVNDSTGHNRLGVINGPIWTNDTPFASSTEPEIQSQLTAEKKVNQERQIQLTEVQEKLTAEQQANQECQIQLTQAQEKLTAEKKANQERQIQLTQAQEKLTTLEKLKTEAEKNKADIEAKLAACEKAKTDLQALLTACQKVKSQKSVLLIITNMEPKSCAKESELKSIEGNAETFVLFKNLSNHVVKIYWLDYRGQRKRYQTLFPLQQWKQHAYLTHPWVITDENDQCLGIFLPKATKTESEVIISECERSSL